MAIPKDAKEEEARVIGLALLLLLLLAPTSSAKTPSPQPQQRTDAQGSAEYGDTVAGQAPTPNIELSPTVTAERGGTYTYNYYYYSEQSGNVAVWAQTFATVGLLLFAFWQMGFVRRATTATEQAASAARDNATASKDSADAAKAAVDAMTKTAGAAKKSADIAEETLRVTTRPWVIDTGVTVGVVEPQWQGQAFSEDKPSRVTLSVKNFGAHPALMVSVNLTWRFCGCEPGEFPEQQSDRVRMELGVLAPGSPFDFSDDIPPLTNPQIDRLVAGDVAIRICGDIVYGDRYQGATEPYDSFCQYLWTLKTGPHIEKSAAI